MSFRKIPFCCLYVFFLLLVAILHGGFCKVYERCELARELKTRHRIPEAELATWVCLARHESEFNTSAVNHVSGDHGLFQISQLFWCSPPGEGHACGLSCDQLKDEDIKDDIICAKRIYREHKRLSGDGFNAWVVYRIHCTGAQVAQYTEGCFDAAYNKEPDVNNEVNFAYNQPTLVSSVLTSTSTKTTTETSAPTTSTLSTQAATSTSTAHARSNSLAKHLSANQARSSTLAKQLPIKPVTSVNYFPYVNNVEKQVANYQTVNKIAKRVYTKPAPVTPNVNNYNSRQTSSSSRSPTNHPYKGFKIINGKVTYY